MQENYKILGVSEDSTNEEIESKYKELKSKYSKERFLEGEAGNIAARELTKIEAAYAEIMEERSEPMKKYNEEPSFSEVEKLIRDGKINEAQDKLDSFSNRDAEWHYMQSVIFYKKNWSNESKKQLEIAMNMDPSNPKYSTAYVKLKNKMESNQRAFHSGNSGYGYDGNPETNRQMGGSDDCLSFCTTWCCMNMLCNACCNQ